MENNNNMAWNTVGVQMMLAANIIEILKLLVLKIIRF